MIATSVLCIFDSHISILLYFWSINVAFSYEHYHRTSKFLQKVLLGPLFVFVNDCILLLEHFFPYFVARFGPRIGFRQLLGQKSIQGIVVFDLIRIKIYYIIFFTVIG